MVSILFGVFFVGLILGIPVALCMGIASLFAMIAIGNLPLEILPQRLFSGINSFPMMTIPFFILASDLMSGGKITEMLVKFSNNLVGHIRGGLGYVNVLVNMLFSGISGSALADAAGPGAIVMGMMRKTGYDSYYSGALSAATSVMGPIIPPSILMVIYALTDGHTSVSGLFLAGVIPGVLIAVSLMVVNFLISKKRNYQFSSKRASLSTIFKSFVKSLPAIFMPVIIMGGILGGIVTATEASAVAVAYALVIGFFVTKGLTYKNVFGIIVKSAIVSSSVLIVIAMGSAFSWVLTYEQVPQHVAEWMTGFTHSTIMVLLMIAFITFITGMFVDTIPAMIILVPVLAPAAHLFGADPLQVAMIITLTLAVGMLTPPVAPLLFVISTIGRLRLEKLSLAVIPMLLAEIAVILLVIFIPKISTFLPAMFGFTN